MKFIPLYIIVNHDLSKYGALIWDLSPIAAQLYSIFILSRACVYLTESLVPGLGFRIAMAPAVIAHEVSHALACLVTFAKVKEITIFQREGGCVSHEKPWVPFGQALISLAPLIGGWLLLTALGGLTGIRVDDQAFQHGWEGWWSTQLSTIQELPQALSHGWTSVVWVYGAGSCALIMIPSSKDISNAKTPLVLLGALFLGVDLVVWLCNGSSFLSAIPRLLSPKAEVLIALQVSVLILLVPLHVFKRLSA